MDRLREYRGPLKSTVEAALAKTADPVVLSQLGIIVFAENDDDLVCPFRFAGSPEAVNYATSLLGEQAPIVSPRIRR